MLKELVSKKSIAQVFLIGEINEELNKEVVQYLLTTDWNDPENKIEKLVIYVSSSGGTLRDCFSIIDTVQMLKEQYKFEVISVVLGEASSAGFFLFLLGDKRIALPNARMYVHEHLTYTDGQTYSERKKDELDQDMLYDSYIKYTADRLGITTSIVKKLVGMNTWLTKEDMVNWKIITK